MRNEAFQTQETCDAPNLRLMGHSVKFLILLGLCRLREEIECNRKSFPKASLTNSLEFPGTEMRCEDEKVKLQKTKRMHLGNVNIESTAA